MNIGEKFASIGYWVFLIGGLICFAIKEMPLATFSFFYAIIMRLFILEEKIKNNHP